MRAGDRLSIDLKGSEGAGSALAAAGLLVQNSMAMDTERLLASMRSDAAAEATGEWKGTTQYARDQLVMTADEARELAAAVERLVAPYAWDKRGRTSPKGATNYSFSVVLAREVDDS